MFPGYRVSLLAFALAVGGTACGESSPIAGPEPLTSPRSALSTGGTVFEHTMSGARPLAGVRLRVFQALPNVPSNSSLMSRVGLMAPSMSPNPTRRTLSQRTLHPARPISPPARRSPGARLSAWSSPCTLSLAQSCRQPGCLRHIRHKAKAEDFER